MRVATYRANDVASVKVPTLALTATRRAPRHSTKVQNEKWASVQADRIAHALVACLPMSVVGKLGDAIALEEQRVGEAAYLSKMQRRKGRITP